MSILHSVKQKACKIIGKNQLKYPKGNAFETIIFRNDDVGYDTHVGHFKDFCDVFHKYGFVQLHGVTLYGRMNCSYVIDGIPCMYDTIKPNEIYDYEICKSVSTDFIGDNHELITFLNSIPDPIALHGLYHSDYSTMTYEQQDHDIAEGLRLLKDLFPNKKVDTFIAPFNHTNDDTYKVCEKYHLRISALEGEHLEDMMEYDKDPLYEGQLYRYHHHRFYPETTFSYYHLSIEGLDKYFKAHAYTKTKGMEHAIPSLGMLSNSVRRYEAQEWYIYAYKDFNARQHASHIEKYIEKYIEKRQSILEVACGAGGMLYKLRSAGFTNLAGYDFDEKAIYAAQEIDSLLDDGISFSVCDARKPIIEKKYDVIVWTNGMYHLDNYSLDDFFSTHLPMLNNDGFLMFDMVNGRFNSIPNNEYTTQDWNKPINQRRPSEYKIRMTPNEVKKVAKKYNLHVVHIESFKEIIPRDIYILQYKKPRVCFLCDRPGWAHDFSAQEIKKELGNEFDIDIKYVISHEDINKKDYDAILIFFWGEESYKRYRFPRKKIIKQVSSHRWQHDAPYGPISTESFVRKYLSDAGTVICPSQILYNMLNPYVQHLFLCGKGASVDLFENKDLIKDNNQLSVCMVGNIDDPVKGVQDILVPSAKGYQLDYRKDLSRNELCDFYNEHDVYAVTSKHEADPLPLIESMMCGCFPVAHDVGIAPELIRHKENGYLVHDYSVDGFREAFAWCEEHLDEIRSKRKYISDEIRSKRNWTVMAENYRIMLRDHICSR